MLINPNVGPSSPAPRGNHRPADPGLSAAEDPVDSCTFGRPSHNVPGESTWKMMLALGNSDFKHQQKAARELHARIMRNETPSHDELEALRILSGQPQSKGGSLQVAGYHQSEQGLGPAKVFHKTEVGYDSREGVFAGTQSGSEVKLEVPGAGPSVSFYSRIVNRTGQEPNQAQVGVEVQHNLGPASVGVDVNNQGGSFTAKLESPALGGQRVGLEASATAPRGNGIARDYAFRALERHALNQAGRL